MPILSIERRELTPQPVLIMRCRTSRGELQAAIGNSLGGVFGHCQKVGLPLDRSSVVSANVLLPRIVCVPAVMGSALGMTSVLPRFDLSGDFA